MKFITGEGATIAGLLVPKANVDPSFSSAM
jgi:hypothetical protein